MAGVGTVFAAYEDQVTGMSHIAVYDNNGEFVRTIDLDFADRFGGFHRFVIGANRTIYFNGVPWVGDFHTLWKLDEEGNILTSVTHFWDWTHCHMAIGKDGYLYIFNQHDNTLEKRDPDTLAVVATLDVGSDGFYGLVFLSETEYITGNHLTMEEYDYRIERWDFITGVIDALEVGQFVFGSLSSFALSGDLLCSVKSHSYAWTLPIDFTEGITTWEIDGMPSLHGGSTSLYNGDFVFIGEVTTSSGVIIARYTPAKELVWKVNVTEAGYHPEQVQAYPYEVVEAVYDYPLAPIMFPVKNRTTTLKHDCINFEESMSSICLVFNNNVKVTRLYLQEVYGDATHPESSNLREILPSQQLVKLHGKDLDYNAIIHNFIKNISDMFILINENNSIVKQWLDDYEPNEEAHEFTDVVIKPIVVGNDLNKAMDDLFEGVMDNVTILNANLEVLKERF